MESIYENLRNERQYSATTGFDKQKFQQLHHTFDKYYKPKNNLLITGEKPVFFQSDHALFFILFYLKTYPTLQVLGLCFNISDASASHYIDYIMPFVKQALGQEKALANRLFSSQQEFDRAFEGVDDIFMDCTEIPIERADNERIQKKAFSGKKNFTP